MYPIAHYSDIDTELPYRVLHSLDESLAIGLPRYVETIADYKAELANLAFTNLPAMLSRGSGPDYHDEYIPGAYMLRYQHRHCIMAYKIWKAILDRAPKLPAEVFVVDVGSGMDAGYIGLVLHLHLSGISIKVNFFSIEPSQAMRKAGRILRESLDSVGLSHRSTISYSESVGIQHRPHEGLRFVTAFHIKMNRDRSINKTDSKPDALQKLGNVLSTVAPHWFVATCYQGKINTLTQGLKQQADLSTAIVTQLDSGQWYSYGPSRVFTELGPRYGFYNYRKSGSARTKVPTGAVLLLDGKWPRTDRQA